jgi:hypothetical protein
MTEVAMAKILLSMECLHLHRGKAYMNIKRWKDLRSELKVTAIEWSASRLKCASSASPWYIWLGEIQYYSSKLYAMWEQGKVVPPSITGQRKATKFIWEELRKILPYDIIQDAILSYTQSRTRAEAEEKVKKQGEKKRIPGLTWTQKMKNQKRRRDKKKLWQRLSFPIPISKPHSWQ